MFAFMASFTAGFIASAVLTPGVRWLARRTRVVSLPRDDRWHRRPVALLGGVAVWAATLMGLVLAQSMSAGVGWLAVTASALFLVGLVDDLTRLKPSTKVTAQIGVACLLLAGGWSLAWSESETLNAVLTILWFVGITNAFNLLDNMDGVCAGVAMIAGIAYGVGRADIDLATVSYSAALAGAAAGFLLYNFQPATIFLGDSGSLFLGASFATLTIVSDTRARTGLISTVAVPTLLLLIPIFDTAFVTFTRKLSARSASVGGRDHTSHRLVALGFSERQTALLIYALTGAAAATAIALDRAHVAGIALAGMLVLGLVLIAVFLSGVKVYDGQDFALLRDSRYYTPLLVDVMYKRRIFEVLLDLCLVTIAYYSAYVVRFDEQFSSNYPVFVKSLPIVIACQIVSFFVAGVYRGVWKYIALSDVSTYGRAVVTGAVSSVIAIVVLHRFEGYSRSVFVIDAMFLAMLLVGSRASFRFFGELANRNRPSRECALIYGAGDGGTLVVRELRNNRRYDLRVAGFIDDDPSKSKRRILGTPVLGGLTHLEQAIAHYSADVVILSTSKLPPDRLDALRDVCFRSGVRLVRLQFELEDIGYSHQPVEPR